LGHKVHPLGFRLGIIKDWQSKWYSEAHYAEFVREDYKLREYIRAKYNEAAISLIEIDRQAKDVTITLHTARPGIVIGRGGQRVDEMRQNLEALVSKKIRLNIQEVRQPELDAYLVARSIAEQIERRVAYRRAMKQAIFRTIQAGARGIKISAAGRLGNAEIARRQTSHQGQVPLHTLRADIDYGFTEARTTLGRIGVKVWIYKGQILPEIKVPEVEEAAEAVAEAKPAEAPAAKAPAAAAEAKPAEPVAAQVAAAAAEEKAARPKARKLVAPAEPETAAKAEAEKPAPRKVAKPAAPEAAPRVEEAKPAPKKAPRAAAPEAAPAEKVAEAKPAPRKAVKPAETAAAKTEEEKPAPKKAAKAAAPETAAKAEAEKPAPKRHRKAAEGTGETTEA
jgi:small subunit ribosomal protein S3